MKLQRFLERLPESTAVIKLKTGSATKQVLEAIFVIEGKEPKMQTGDLTPEYLNFDNAESIIVEEGENLGWGEDFTHIRLHAYDEDMNHLKSLSLPRTLKTNESDSVGPDQAIAANPNVSYRESGTPRVNAGGDNRVTPGSKTRPGRMGSTAHAS